MSHNPPRIFQVPAILFAVETKGFSGNMWPHLKALYPGRESIERSSRHTNGDRPLSSAVVELTDVGAPVLDDIHVVPAVPVLNRRPTHFPEYTMSELAAAHS
jgi:hypothetical protein